MEWLSLRHECYSENDSKVELTEQLKTVLIQKSPCMNMKKMSRSLFYKKQHPKTKFSDKAKVKNDLKQYKYNVLSYLNQFKCTCISV